MPGGTRDMSKSKVNGNANNLHGHSMARAQDGGTWSRSMTQTKVHKGGVPFAHAHDGASAGWSAGEIHDRNQCRSVTIRARAIADARRFHQY